METLLAFLAAFGFVFIAELGDRTQWVLFALATRHPRGPLFLGAGAAFLVQTLLAVIVGDRLAAWLPTGMVLLLGALVFFVLGALALKGALASQGEDHEAPQARTRKGGFVAAFLFVLIAELGDKTQITTAALTAAGNAPLATFLGAFLALLASTAMALLFGRWVALKLPAQTTRVLAAVIFLAAGVLMAVLAVLAWH